jgi:hypothetical protein
MKRVAAIVLFWAGIALVGLAQVEPHSPAEPDPHENPVDVHAGQRDAPAQEPAQPLTVPSSPTPRSKQAKPAVKLPILESETAILGTWDLVPEKSHFSPDATAPKETRTYVKTPAGIEATVTTTLPDGRVRTITYPWRVDGKEYPVKGSPLLDTIVLKQVDNLTAEATLKHGDTVLASERREFSADGKTMSITVTDATSEHAVSSKAVYQKRGSKPTTP